MRLERGHLAKVTTDDFRTTDKNNPVHRQILLKKDEIIEVRSVTPRVVIFRTMDGQFLEALSCMFTLHCDIIGKVDRNTQLNHSLWEILDLNLYREI